MRHSLNHSGEERDPSSTSPTISLDAVFQWHDALVMVSLKK